jgi:Zn-finger nucleic acid-binding protein
MIQAWKWVLNREPTPSGHASDDEMIASLWRTVDLVSRTQGDAEWPGAPCAHSCGSAKVAADVHHRAARGHVHPRRAFMSDQAGRSGRSPSPAPGLLCPNCRADLVMSERQGIEIDYCPKCRGVWLDRGELDKIIERSAAELSAPAAPPPPPSSPSRVEPRAEHGQGYDRSGQGYGHGHRDEYRHHKRRKSFLEDLFD